MNTSPHVSFTFVNENTQLAAPPLGISGIVAVTTRGRYDTPILVKNWGQFQREFGQEVVPDNTLSNIERALSMGSQLLVSRAKPSGEITNGIGKPYDASTQVVAEETADVHMVITNTNLTPTETYEVIFNIRTKEAGILPNGAKGIWVSLLRTITGNTCVHSLVQSYSLNENQPSAIIATTPVITSVIASTPNSGAFNDASVLESFALTIPNLELVVKSTTLPSGASTLQDVVDYLKENSNFKVTFTATIAGANMNSNGVTSIYSLEAGSPGEAPKAQDWKDAFDRLLDFTTYYSVGLSHIHQHLSSDYEEVLKYASDKAKALQEFVLYAEVPKSNNTVTTLEAKATAMLGSVGSHRNLAFFGGGIKLYHKGVLKDCDVLGTVIGLGDTSAKTKGYYASFAGMNRGLVPDSSGPVISNLGSPTKYDDLNRIAQVKTAVFVVKDTPNAGRQTMLWHNFTTSPLNNSDKFLSSVRFGLYLKKHLRPILESKLEEPNYIPLWKDIYYEGKHLLDDLIGLAVSSYQWIGDQNATGYDDMVVNTEAEVRLGKYKLVIRYKDIVSLQEVEVTLVVDSSTRAITLE